MRTHRDVRLTRGIHDANRWILLRTYPSLARVNTRAHVFVVAAALGGCPKTPVEDTTGGMSGLDRGEGGEGGVSLGGKDVGPVLGPEQDALAALDAKIARADGDELVALRHDRTARASFIAQLERCAEDALACPPSFDEPVIPDAFDPATHTIAGERSGDWPAAAEAIHVAACGCRTRACVDWVLADLLRWESSMTPHEQDEGTAAERVTAARECLWSRLGY